MKAKKNSLRRAFAVVLMVFGVSIMMSCGDTSCECLMTYVPNNVVQGYGYNVTLDDVDKTKCENADREIWDKEMKKIDSLLTAAGIDYQLSCVAN
ncbi:MAG: hypothetical protein LBO06_05950 [Bacteroidales bacterium]|jgi:hypothetical protein|nr:hypothetical protein [Bacteroidales bacterium]